MRDSVAQAWPAMCRRYEGVTTYMYLDTKGLVTTGVGFLIDSVAAAQKLDWWLPDGKLATKAQVEAEWRAVKALQSWKVYNGLSTRWSNRATMRLPDATVSALLDSMTPRYWNGVVASAPNVEQAPADAQLALLDLSWQNGPAFLNGWPDTRAAVRAGDWSKVADLLESFLPEGAARTTRRVVLFHNAAAVVRMGLDPEVLWDGGTPTAPPPPEPVPPAPTPTPGDTMALSDSDVDRIAKKTAALVLEQVGEKVWGYDGIPNTFTANTANVNVTPKTALQKLGEWLRPVPAPPAPPQV